MSINGVRGRISPSLSFHDGQMASSRKGTGIWKRITGRWGKLAHAYKNACRCSQTLWTGKPTTLK